MQKFYIYIKTKTIPEKKVPCLIKNIPKKFPVPASYVPFFLLFKFRLFSVRHHNCSVSVPGVVSSTSFVGLVDTLVFVLVPANEGYQQNEGYKQQQNNN